MGSSATVFGLDVSSDVPLSFLQHARAAPTGRRLAISVADKAAAAPAWPNSAELVCDQRESDGTASFSIEAHPAAGYLIRGPSYGSHLLSPDGRRALCMPGDCAEGAWQRLLIAQVLPFAAVLHGLEVLHASAVVADGSAIAFVGPSRAGKTSIALELCRLGATFLADDVLTLERTGEDLLGHPGTPVAGIDHAEVRRLARIGDTPRGQPLAINTRERLIRMRGASEPAPLGALFFLDRRRDGPDKPIFEPAADAQQLLAATFNSVLTDSRRLRGLLDVCALLARRRVERIRVGPNVDPAELTAAVQRRIGAPA